MKRREKKDMLTNHMEEDLDVPLRKVIQIMGDSIIKQTRYFGVWTVKNPLDSWVYQEIIYETKPDVIVEIGNFNGGSTLFLAHLCDLLGKGRVIGIDLSHENIKRSIKMHPRINFIEGDACQILADVKKLISRNERVLVIDDSSHTYENTLNVLRLYSKLIKPGDYFIVEDSILHHGLDFGPSPGPYEAVETFINENNDFEIDRSREHFYITFNPKGYLRRKTFDGIYQYGPKGSFFRTKMLLLTKIIDLFLPPILIKLVRRLKILK